MKMNKKSLQLLPFTICDMVACLDIDNIHKVIALPFLEKVPEGPAYLVGLLNYAGTTLPVIDLAFRLGLSREKRYSIHAPILLCEYENKQCGLIVDQVSDLIAVRPESLQIEEKFKSEDSLFLATIQIQNRLALLLNIENIIKLSQILEKSHQTFTIKY